MDDPYIVYMGILYTRLYCIQTITSYSIKTNSNRHVVSVLATISYITNNTISLLALGLLALSENGFLTVQLVLFIIYSIQ